jgi:hypothetical protein
VASRIAEAYVQIVPSMTGVQGSLEKEFSNIGGPVGDKMGGGMLASFKKIAGPMAAVIGGLAIASFAKDTIEALNRIEVLSAQTSAVLESTGSGAWTSTAAIVAMADGLEKLTSTESESIQEGANLLLTFKNVQNQAGKGNDIFDQSTAVMVDLARAMGTDVSTGAIQLGKALNDPTLGISALSRVGITFTGEQEDMIRTMQESGDVMGAQKVILGELTSQFGGSGAAYAETFQGKLDGVQNSLGGLGESIVSAVLPALEGFVSAAQPVLDWLEANPAAMNALAIAVGVLAAAFVAITIATWASNIAFMASPITWIVLAVIALIAAVVLLIVNWDNVVKFLLDVWGGFVGWLMDGLNAFVGWWNGLWTAVFEFILSVWNNIVASVVGYFTNLWNSFVAIGRGIYSWWSGLWSGLVGVFTTVFNGIGGIVQGVFNGVVNFIKGYINTIIRLVNGAINGLNGVGNFIAGITGGAVDFKIGKIPMLASGGTITGSGSVMVGEQGPEILNLGRGASVIPLDRAGRGGDSYTFTGQMGLSADDVAEKIEKNKRRALSLSNLRTVGIS